MLCTGVNKYSFERLAAKGLTDLKSTAADLTAAHAYFSALEFAVADLCRGLVECGSAVLTQASKRA